MRIAAPGKTIVYSADTAPTERLARFAHGADLFMCEAALRDASSDSKRAGPHGRRARRRPPPARARVGQLLLTHVPERERPRGQVLELARSISTAR